MKTKSITIKKNQEKWLQKKAINLSKFVRNKIQDTMGNYNGGKNE